MAEETVMQATDQTQEASIMASLKRLADIIDQMGDMSDDLIHPAAWKAPQCEEALTEARQNIAKAEGRTND